VTKKAKTQVAIPAPGSAIPRMVNHQTLRTLAEEALVTNRNFIAQPSPGAGLITAQVKQMVRQQNALIRLVIEALEATD